jgi:exonuclease 3'-5' domain-containing protein 1
LLHANLDWQENAAWQRVKEAGGRLLYPDRGGQFDRINDRPLPQALLDYCVQDVTLLPRVWHKYMDRPLSSTWKQRIKIATADRLSMACRRQFKHGKHMALAPEGWPR